MTTIRELIARFGIEADTTPITRFNTAINQATANLRRLSTIQLKGLDKALKKFLNDASNVLEDEEVKSTYQKKIDNFNKFLRKAFLTTAAVIAAGFAATFKAFKRFGVEEQAEARLEFQLSKIPGAFEETKKKIQEASKEVDGMISKIKYLNAASASFGIATDPELFNRIIGYASKLSIVLGKDLVEVVSALSSFVATGSVEGLKELGLTTAQILELQSKSQAGYSKLAIAGRTKVLFDEMEKNIEGLNKAYKSFRTTGAASSKRLEAATDDFVVEVGKSSDSYKELNNKTASFLRKIIKKREEEIGWIDALTQIYKELSIERGKEAIEIRKRIQSQKKAEGTGTFFSNDPDNLDLIYPLLLGNRNINLNQPMNSTINNTITINGVDTSNAGEVGRVVEEKIEQAIETNNKKYLNNKIIRGKNQLP